MRRTKTGRCARVRRSVSAAGALVAPRPPKAHAPRSAGSSPDRARDASRASNEGSEERARLTCGIADGAHPLARRHVERVEGIEITSNAVPDDEIRYASDPDVEARTVYLVTREATIGVIVKRTTEQDVTRADGATFTRDLPSYERVGLPLSENTSLTCATHLSDCR